MPVSRVSMTTHDLKVSRFIAGFWRLNSWNMSLSELQSFVEDLLELGISTMDHAFVYKSEGQFGELLKAAPELRSKMEIISKFGIRPCGFGQLGAEKTNYYDSSAAYLNQSVDNTLRKLNIEQIDIMLIHRPDFLMAVDEIAREFEALVQSGKVRYFGVSNFTTSQFELLKSRYSFPLVTNQVEYSPLCLDPLENGILDQSQLHRCNPMFWSCLAGGRLMTGSDERSLRVRKALEIVGKEVGAESLEQVIFAWILKHPSKPLPILGTSNIQRIKNAISAEFLNLSREQWYSIWEASKGHRVP